MRKPRGQTPIALPIKQPDCCFECPLLGIIPQEERKRGSKETRVCLGTWEALSGRGVMVRASRRDSHHPLRRPCDMKWEVWTKMPERMFLLPDEAYLRYRVPFESGRMFKIKFH